MQTLWYQVRDLLTGKSLVQGQPIDIQLPHGTVELWVMDAVGKTQVDTATAFSIIDIIRNPKLIYRCRVCGGYGPLRCNRCVDENRPEGQERLCTTCAHD